MEEAKGVYDEIGSAAFLVIHQGAVVVAWGNYEFPYMCHSMRKSILSSLYGLGSIFEQETKRGLFTEFETQLARPLHMEDYSPEIMKCYKDERYSIHGAHHYRLSARDLARFGMFYLQKGKWGSKQLLPESWVVESTTPYSIPITRTNPNNIRPASLADE